MTDQEAIELIKHTRPAGMSQEYHDAVAFLLAENERLREVLKTIDVRAGWALQQTDEIKRIREIAQQALKQEDE